MSLAQLLQHAAAEQSFHSAAVTGMWASQAEPSTNADQSKDAKSPDIVKGEASDLAWFKDSMGSGAIAQNIVQPEQAFEAPALQAFATSVPNGSSAPPPPPPGVNLEALAASNLNLYLSALCAGSAPGSLAKPPAGLTSFLPPQPGAGSGADRAHVTVNTSFLNAQAGPGPGMPPGLHSASSSQAASQCMALGGLPPNFLFLCPPMMQVDARRSGAPVLPDHDPGAEQPHPKVIRPSARYGPAWLLSNDLEARDD